MIDIRDLTQDPIEGAGLDQQTLDSLLGQRISMRDLTTPWAVTKAQVCFEPWADRYFPAFVGELALIFGIIDAGEVIDYAAWWPYGNRIGTRLGAGACLGQGQIGRDGLGMADRPLPVFRSPITWLQRNRCGLVIADRFAAAHLLVDVAITAEDGEHEIELRRDLTLRSPLIVRCRGLAA